MAVRQGALQLRDLHEDTTGPGQGREGGGDVLKLNVNSTGKQYLSHEPQLTIWSCHVTVSPSDSSDDRFCKIFKLHCELHHYTDVTSIVKGRSKGMGSCDGAGSRG